MSVLKRAHAHAVRLGHDRIGGEALLLGSLHEGFAHALLVSEIGLSRDVLVWRLENSAREDSSPAVGSLEGYSVTAEVLHALRSDPPGAVELIVGLLYAEGGTARVLGDHGVTPELVRQAQERIIDRFSNKTAWGGRSPAPERGPADPPIEIDVLSAEIAEYRRRKEAAVDAQEYTQAGIIRDAEKQVVRRRSELIREWAATVDPVVLAEAVVSLREQVASADARSAE